MENKFSLWLIPDYSTKQHAALRSIIDRVSRVFNTPAFDPHVTLLGGIEQTREVVLRRAKQFADKQRPFEIFLGDIGSKANPMQIFFSEVKKTEELADARVACSDIMIGTRNYQHFPHLSLAYGDLTNEQVEVLKDEIARSSFKPEQSSFVAWGVSVWNTFTLNPRDWTEEEYFKFPIK